MFETYAGEFLGGGVCRSNSDDCESLHTFRRDLSGIASETRKEG